MRILLFILTAIILTGCATQRRCERKFPATSQVITKDSTVIREIIVPRDTVIKTYVEIPQLVVKDSNVITYINGTPVVKPIILSGSYSSATAWIEGGKLKGQLNEGGAIELQAKVTLLEKQISEQHASSSDTVIEKPVRYVPWGVKALAWIGGAALLVLLGSLLIRLLIRKL